MTTPPGAVASSVGQGVYKQHFGIYAASVQNNNDPLQLGRCQLFVPQVLGGAMSNWADRIALGVQTGKLPVVGHTVYCVFLGGDINRPAYFEGTQEVTNTQLNSLSVLGNITYQQAQTSTIANIQVLGADYTGNSAADSALALAASTIGTNNGMIYVPAGRYKVTSNSGWLLNLTDAQQVIVYCEPGAVFNYTGTGDCIRMLGANTSFRSRGSGILGNPTIDGTSAGAGSSGLHFGDIQLGQVYASVQNFSGTGSINFHFDNTIGWTEQLQGKLYSLNGTNGIVFDVSGANTSTNSFARAFLDIVIGSGGVTHNGLVVQNGALPYDSRISMIGNFIGSSAGPTPGAVISLTGTVPAGHPGAGNPSRILTTFMDFGVESGAGAVTTQTINFGASANYIDAFGILNFNTINLFTPSNLAASGSQFRFNGPIYGDTSLSSTRSDGTWVRGAIGNNQTIFPNNGGNISVNPAAAVTGIIIATAARDGQRLTIVNLSGNSLTFAAAGTSNVAAGVGASVPANTSKLFIWNAATALWYGGV